MPLVFSALLACTPLPSHAQDIQLDIEDIRTDTFQASGIRASLHHERFSATIGQLSLPGHQWKNVRLLCPRFRIEADTLSCDQGSLQEKQSWPIRFRFSPQTKQLELELSPTARESWRFVAHWGKGWELSADIRNGSAALFKSWLPPQVPAPSSGKLDGRLRFTGNHGALLAAEADLKIDALAFSDTSGLHAGEKIDGKIHFQLKQVRGESSWKGVASWDKGEIYWHPLYVTGGGIQLSANGRANTQRIALDQGLLHWPALGDVHATAEWRQSAKQFSAASFDGSALNLEALYRTLILPYLEKTALAKSTASGTVSLSGRFSAGELLSLDAKLGHASLQDKDGRFALRDFNLTLPWRANSASSADFDIASGQILALPIGGFKATAHLQDKTIRIPKLAIPILGGKFNIDHFKAAQAAEGWNWEFDGGLTPVSMEQLSAAMHWPKMHGTLAGVIPRMQYESGKLVMDGALLINAFDGTAVIQDLALLDGLGHAPRLQASIDMRNLDLDLLTRAFSFGNMQGRVDVAVKGLELSNWKPVSFDAAIRSSPGDYPRKISQRAVQNISALGGAGAAAAIQRSFMGFFEEFGYSRLGLSCVLRNSVCLMDGVEPAPNGYVIVKGGGIPAITVIGYNRSVSWDELISRLQRVTQGNAKPVVQ